MIQETHGARTNGFMPAYENSQTNKTVAIYLTFKKVSVTLTVIIKKDLSDISHDACSSRDV